MNARELARAARLVDEHKRIVNLIQILPAEELKVSCGKVELILTKDAEKELREKLIREMTDRGVKIEAELLDLGVEL